VAQALLPQYKVKHLLFDNKTGKFQGCEANFTLKLFFQNAFSFTEETSKFAREHKISN